jgi:hypothetical protein
MNPVFRFIDWMLREHGAFVSGLIVYVAIPLTAWYLGRRGAEENEGKPYVHLGYTPTNGADGRSACDSVGN